MLPKQFGHNENLKNPEQPPAPARQTWIALALIVALVLLVIVVLTAVGAGEAAALEVMR